MKTIAFLWVLSVASLVQSQTLKIVTLQVPDDGRTPVFTHFLCSSAYEPKRCVADATTLREALAPYPLQDLGEWSFVLVPAADWQSLVNSLGGDPASPAGSILKRRVTLLSETLFPGPVSRSQKTLERFRLVGPALLNLAISHELGHALCQEPDERRADAYGRELRDGKAPDCSKTPRRQVVPRSADRGNLGEKSLAHK